MRKYITLLLLLTAACNKPVKTIEKPSEPKTIPEVTITASPPKVNRNELVLPLIKTMLLEHEERLPFDEPRHEYGHQLDGRLRPAWRYKYLHKGWRYAFNGDWYPTMYKGKPWVPQVCADFIVDTIDRTAGTWYSDDLKNPERYIGNFDMRGNMKQEGLDPRRVVDLIQYFTEHPEWFEMVHSGTVHQGPPVGKTKELQHWLKYKDVQLGDILIIQGRAPWDYERYMHYHSLIVSSMEEGYVTHVFGNPVFPMEKEIGKEMARAPKRRVVNIIRMTDKFLTKINGSH